MTAVVLDSPSTGHRPGHSPIPRRLFFPYEIRARQRCTVQDPTPISRLCRISGIKGNLVPDAFLAALAIESGSEWISTDRDYHRFPCLRVRHPLE